MTPTQQFKTGFSLASKMTGVSMRQACIKSGINETTLRRFMHGQTDIRLVTLAKLCEEGFGMTFHKVYMMGGE